MRMIFKDSRNRVRAVESEENPVPIHRSYGVRKKEGFFAWLNNRIAGVFAIILFAFLAIMWVLGLYALMGALGVIGTALGFVVTVCLVYFVGFRRIRKRRKFLHKLKKTCKKCNFKLDFKRKFFDSIRFHSDGLDFTVETGEKLYCVKIIPSKKLSHVIFYDKDTVHIRTNITRSHFKLVLGLNKPKLKIQRFGFANTQMPHTSKQVQKITLLNPVPLDMFYRDSDGAVIATGNGHTFYDYTLYAGTGFINLLLRQHEDENNTYKNRYSDKTVGH